MTPLDRYRLYGVRMDSEHRFRLPLWPGSGPAELTLRWGARLQPEPPAERAVYRSPRRTVDGDSVSVLYRLDGGELLRFPPDGAFQLAGDRILSRRPGPGGARLFEIRFLGALMAYWLERRGVLALHASAVEVDGRAVAFVGAHGAGKSSLAATLAAAGHRLLTDDLLAVESTPGGPLARAGYPVLRLDRGQLERFVPARRGLRRVQPAVDKWFVPVERLGGSFQPASLPLAAICLLRRAPAERAVGLSAVAGAEAVIELVRCSFSPYVVEAVGLQPARLERLAALAEEVPVRWLPCPEGLDRLAALRHPLLAELAASG